MSEPTKVPTSGSRRSGGRIATPALEAASFAFIFAIAVLAGALPAAAQEGEDRALRLVTPDDYGEFESLGGTTLSPDALWLAASIGRVEGDGELRLHRTDGDSVIVFENGTGPGFSSDSRWAAITVRPGEEERRRLQRDRRPVRSDLILLDLRTGDTIRRPEVSSWSFSSDGRYLTMRRYRSGEGEARGSDIVVREMETGIDLNLGNVSEAEWHDELSLLAMVIDAEGKVGNGIRLYDAEAGTLRPLQSQEARFSGLSWRDEAADLAVLRVDPDTIRGDTLHAVLTWRQVNGGDPEAEVLEGAIPGADGEELRITDYRGLRWSEDGSRIFFGAMPRDASAEDPAEAEEPADEKEEEEEEAPPRGGTARSSGSDQDSVPGLEIWHARDVDPVPQQRLRANQTRRSSELVAWEPGADRPVILGGRDADHSISLIGDDDQALILDSSPYAQERMFGPVYRDVYTVDIESGERARVLERIEYFTGASPGGRYLLFFQNDAWHAFDLREGRTANLTGGLSATFVNEAHDHTVTQKRPHGTGGWLDDDAAVLLYDEFDIWRVSPDGNGGERLTRGAEAQVRHRAMRLDTDRRTFAPDEPLYVTLYGEWTKESGYARLHPDGNLQTLVYGARSISRLSRSDDEQLYTYVEQRYDLSPNVHVTDRDFANVTRITRVNEHVTESFLWGRSELVDYENEWGVRLQGALFYPADYEPGRRYPMIVYPYERRSQVLHSWSNPSERSAYNTTVFTQNGYFVLQPDVVYRPRNPGVSFMEAVIPAVDAAIATGMIDPERVGLTGHSWGGYQTTFAVTQTDRFAAAVAGAPLTNLISMYLSFYWNSGGTDARIFELSQGRMEVPWWEDYESYRANSPVHHIERMDTPLLMAFGTEDGAVEFNQGVEFYNAARRAAKDFVLLVYEGENHSLRERPNQIDYHRRSLEWFDHYLKGAEAPAWITEGVSYLEQEKKLEAGPAAGRVPGVGGG